MGHKKFQMLDTKNRERISLLLITSHTMHSVITKKEDLPKV